MNSFRSSSFVIKSKICFGEGGGGGGTCTNHCKLIKNINTGKSPQENLLDILRLVTPVCSKRQALKALTVLITI